MYHLRGLEVSAAFLYRDETSHGPLGGCPQQRLQALARNVLTSGSAGGDPAVPPDPVVAPEPTPSRTAPHASIVEVAALAGVSPSTVSRALRGLPNVSSLTRQRVHEAARELSYVVSPSASRLASGQTRSIGVVVPFVTRWFFANTVAGACDVLAEAGYDVLLYHLGNAEARDRFFDRLPVARRVDAVLTLTVPLSDDHTLGIRALGMPLVTVGAQMAGVTSVRIDDLAAAQSAVNHLIHQGHESVWMISGPSDEGQMGFTSSRDRVEGYRSAMRTAGLMSHYEEFPSSRHGIEGGAEAMAAMLSGDLMPTALFAEYDELAIGAVRTLRRAGIDVPGQVSVVGVDDHEMASVVDLTTVAQQVYELGALAARLLVDTLAGDLTKPADVVLPTRLVVRGSSAPPARRRPRVTGDGRLTRP
jgi:DNA-binding LacI/PurR family transcriptional regulator